MSPRKKIKNEDGAVVTVQGDADSESISADIRRRKNNGGKTNNSKDTVEVTSTSLLDLNDDCLYEIFDLTYVSVVDLCALTQTCTRLKGIGTRIFKIKHRICDFNSMAVEQSVAAGDLLNTFGSIITELRIDLSPYSFGAERMIDSMVQNCTALKSLTIESYKVPDTRNAIAQMGLLFEKLEILHMQHVYIEGFEEDEDGYGAGIITPNGHLINCFAKCNSLIVFKIVYCINFERAIFESYYPKLQHFEYNIGGAYMSSNVDGFILRHSNLKSFILESDSEDDHAAVVAFKVIDANCKKLEKLEFVTSALSDEFETSLECLKEFEHLTELKIHWMGKNVTNLIKELRSKSLKSLDLQYIEGFPELIPDISQLKTLHVLKLHEVDMLRNLNPLGALDKLTELYIFTIESEELNLKFDLIRIVERLINLRKLKFNVNQFAITKYLYRQLVNVVQKRSDAENRHLVIDCPITNDFDRQLLCRTVEFQIVI